LKNQLAEFHETVEQLLQLRDELSTAVQEITKDSKLIKFELEKSVELNRLQEERIKVLEDESATADQERSLNDMLQTRNEELLNSSNILFDENQKLKIGLDASDIDAKDEIFDLKRRIDNMKVLSFIIRLLTVKIIEKN
jgi:DNA integrity scanning protein DisA with diadenylate cyclase activity